MCSITRALATDGRWPEGVTVGSLCPQHTVSRTSGCCMLLCLPWRESAVPAPPGTLQGRLGVFPFVVMFGGTVTLLPQTGASRHRLWTGLGVMRNQCGPRHSTHTVVPRAVQNG